MAKCVACGSKARRDLDVRGLCPDCQARRAELRQPAPPRPPAALPDNRLTTLGELPGHRITECLGLVTAVSSNAMFTAATKGTEALKGARDDLAAAAARMDADAVVGVTVAAFGARGGVTAIPGFAGDAVGVVLTGTAVKVAPAAAVHRHTGPTT